MKKFQTHCRILLNSRSSKGRINKLMKSYLQKWTFSIVQLVELMTLKRGQTVCQSLSTISSHPLKSKSIVSWRDSIRFSKSSKEARSLQELHARPQIIFNRNIVESYIQLLLRGNAI